MDTSGFLIYRKEIMNKYLKIGLSILALLVIRSLTIGFFTSVLANVVGLILTVVLFTVLFFRVGD